MNKCEAYQINISAMMDGELQGEELTETVRHLTACTKCMGEFHKFQALQKRVTSELSAPPAPAGVWENISSEAPVSKKAIFLPLRSNWVRYIGIAAAFVLFFGMGYYFHQSSLLTENPNNPIVLASNPGNMTDAQFLGLTRELLTADPVYHQKMYQILRALNRDNREESFQDLEEDRSSSSVDIVTVDGSEKKDVYKF